MLTYVGYRTLDEFKMLLIKTTKSSVSLLKIRLWFYSLATLHLIFAALYIVNIDMSVDKDPAVQEYTYTRWKLITSWFNLVTMAYYPICLYCDWKELNGKWDEKRVRSLRQIRDLVMTSILFPTTMYSDFLFWRVWNKDRSLIAPVDIFLYMPAWTHHSLHTVSAVTIIIDLLLVPRKRPDSLLPGLSITVAFLSIYTSMVAYNYMNGIAVYAILNVFSPINKILLITLAYIEHFFFYTVQWCVVDKVWGEIDHLPDKND